MFYKVSVYTNDYSHEEYFFNSWTEAGTFARLALNGWRLRKDKVLYGDEYKRAKVTIEEVEGSIEDIDADDSAESDS